MAGQQTGSTVLLSDADDAAAMAADLTHRSHPTSCYRSMADLVHDRQLSSVAVLVLRCQPHPKGTLLALLAKVNVEFPWVQKVMVLDGPLPLPFVEYLTACGVDFVQFEIGDESDVDQLASVVDRLLERTHWLTPWNQGGGGWGRPAKEKQQ